VSRGAEFRSKCAVCGDWIEEGDIIVYDAAQSADEDGDWVHEECVDE